MAAAGVAGAVLAGLTIVKKYLVDPIAEHIGYFINLNSNVESLGKELKKLEDKKVDVQRRVDDAHNNVEQIDNTVNTWLTSVDGVHTAGNEIINDKAQLPKGCFNEWCLNLKSRNVLSKKAKKKTLDILQLQKEGNFQNVAVRTPPIPFTEPISTITFAFRESVIDEIIKKLKDDNINIIGICGMGGVGKTTMMNEVFVRVLGEKVFENYAKTYVSQKFDSVRVQSDIAEWLDLRFDGGNRDLRASRLNQRLVGKKVLIILDDVWEKFDLHALGITLQGGQKRCKILYTSRYQQLWDERPDKKDVPLDVLHGQEPLNLFSQKVGDLSCMNEELQQLALDIVQECAGLPLSLVTLGSALREKSIHAWKDTLLKLKTVSGVEEKGFHILKLSYDFLVKDEAKSLFLLCSFFEKGSDILVENLVRMGMGLKLFKEIDSVEAARDRVFVLIEHLRSCFLVSSPKVLLHRGSFIKVHDIVREVSRKIASTEKSALVVEPGHKSRESVKSSIWLSLISRENVEFPPINLDCPRLELLYCIGTYSQLPSSCFNGMQKLLVLYGYDNRSRELPPSLQFPESLRTLSLKSCHSAEFEAIGKLLNLEILHIYHMDIKILPKKIAQLSNLMLLDLSTCFSLKIISLGIISALVNLEELYLGMLNIDWEWEENEEGIIAGASFVPLRILHIRVNDPHVLPRFPFAFGYLKKYHIVIGRWSDDAISELSLDHDHEKILAINLDTSYLHGERQSEFKFLVRNTVVLLLKGKFTKDLVQDFILERSRVIKHLTLIETDTLEYLSNTMDGMKGLPPTLSTLESLRLESENNLQQLIYGPVVEGSFAKLKDLKIEFCQHLTNVFLLPSTAGSSKLEFLELERLEIGHVPNLVSFCTGDTEIVFLRLKHLVLVNIPKVECVISKSSDQSSSDSGIYPSQSLFPHKVSFPSVVKMTIWEMVNMKDIWGKELHAGSFYNLVHFSIRVCPGLQKLFSPVVARYLVQLETLRVWTCSALEEVVSREEEDVEKSTLNIFPKLKKVKLMDVLALERFCHVGHDLEFIVLEEVHITNCPKLETFAAGFVRTPNLIGVKFTETGKTLWKGDLNGTIQHLHEHKNWVEKNSGDNCFMIYAKEILIAWGTDPRYWQWSDLKVSSDEIVSVAELKEVCWLEVQGSFLMEKLSPGILYRVAFLVMLKDSAHGWEAPLKLKLILPDGKFQEREEILMGKPRGQWIEIVVGEFRTSTDDSGDIQFFLHEMKGGQWKRGLLIKGVAIQPII